MAYGYTLEAEYEDGYVHSELVLGDRSTYVEGKNVFDDIVKRRPRQEHGKLIRFSAFGSRKSYHIDFSDFPATAKPIYYRYMERKLFASGEIIGDPYATAHFFGYEYHDADGTKHKEVIEIH